MGQCHGPVAGKVRRQIAEQSESCHARAMPMGRIREPPFGPYCRHIGFGQSRLDQDVRSVDTRIEKAHGWNIGPWPFGSFG